MLRHGKGYLTASFDRDFNQSTMDFLTPAGFLHLVRFYMILPKDMVFNVANILHNVYYRQLPGPKCHSKSPQLWLHAPLWGSACGWLCLCPWMLWWWWPQIAAHGGSHHGVLLVETTWMSTETYFWSGSVHRIACFQGASNEDCTTWTYDFLCWSLLQHTSASSLVHASMHVLDAKGYVGLPFGTGKELYLCTWAASQQFG